MSQGKIGIEDLGKDLKDKINKTIEVSEDIIEGEYTYTHPNNSQTRHVTDLEKATWNDKADKTDATIEISGLMSSADKNKLNNIESNANNYSHPSTHPANMISIADTSNLFTATDVEGALKEVFQNASNGKSAIATAITGKGVEASENDNFITLANKIGQISAGAKVETGTFVTDKTYPYFKTYHSPPLGFTPKIIFASIYGTNGGFTNSIFQFITTELSKIPEYYDGLTMVWRAHEFPHTLAEMYNGSVVAGTEPNSSSGYFKANLNNFSFYLNMTPGLTVEWIAIG